MKKYLKKIASRVSGKVLFRVATAFLFVGTMAVNFCAVPYWHNEPAMPKSLMEE